MATFLFIIMDKLNSTQKMDGLIDTYIGSITSVLCSHLDQCRG